MGVLLGPGVAAVGGVADGDGLVAVVAHRLFVTGELGQLGASHVQVGEDQAVAGVGGPLLGFVQGAGCLGDVGLAARRVMRGEGDRAPPGLEQGTGQIEVEPRPPADLGGSP